MKEVTLNNGVRMPILGYGAFQIPDAKQCERCVVDAIASGYRLIDTAASYLNEEAVGRGIKNSAVPREQLFVTTKLWVQDAGYERTRIAIDNSLRRLQREIVSLAKSVRKERMLENLAIFDFERSKASMARIAGLDTGTSSFFSHRDPAIVKWMSERRLDV